MSGHPAIAGLRLVLGGNVFGMTADRDASFAVLDTFYELGGRMIDTAEGYSAWVPGHKGGESETMIGLWLDARGVRADMRIATKTNMYGKPGMLAPGKLAAALDGSLERLRTDYVDLFYAHRDDPQTPLDEVAEGFDALVKAGKIRSSGASNFTAERLAASLDAAARVGATPYTALQNEYNLVARDQYEGAVQDLCVKRGVIMLPYYGLASGFLTGKYRSEADLAGRARGESVRRYLQTGQAALATLDAVAAETGATQAQVALAWINAKPGIGAPIASATSAEQVRELCGAASLVLQPEQVARLDAAR
ncbi:aldo/keto reductase [Novosphingobium sp.]|uniref:aldo/keto reductase n=1 Tax=Novosphingobium sp. TaxID=1874826 RepID=UPI0025EDDFDB|nr:aldo/keto reductase [Novosphingobium sp.]